MWPFDVLCPCLPFTKQQTMQVNSATFLIKSQLGEGGYSFVYLGEDTKTKELIALKKTCAQTPEQLKVLHFYPTLRICC
jgi:serine/threonine protein kinase